VIECVPNVSEGRRRDVVELLARAVTDVADVRLLDASSDASHNRSVFTFAGETEPVANAMLALFERAVVTINIQEHSGVHPRVGVVDVVPFVPLSGSTMAECVALARLVGSQVSARHDVPVYLYEQAATAPERRRLEHIRRGGLAGLAARMHEAGWAPDYGPTLPHPTAGVAIVGARAPLIAFNVNLATDRLDVARRIARTIRESSGGMAGVKAIGVPLADRGLVQVSMNLTDLDRTRMLDAFEAVRREAGRDGVAVLESELIGLAPAAALTADQAAEMRLRDFTPARLLERRLLAGGD
jgi:glutamate formiminotransferase